MYGASPEEWTTFDLVLGLTQDLLPVVSNPQAKISPPILNANGKQIGGSRIKDLGKVPSRYNSKREVVGLPEWTSFIATDRDIKKWLKEEDYGICVQTRYVRALDIDISDSVKVQDIHSRILEFSNGNAFPIRRRSNSAKCLVAFRLQGEFAKRILKTENGIIEFLANGQQFIAAGTHPSGARYEWDGLTDIPELTVEEFERLWSALAEKFGTEAPSTGSVRQHGETFAASDDTIGKLTVLGWGPSGQAHILCPFAGEHTSGSGESATSYFPAGTKGYEQGHFICLHAHCANRRDDEFMDALGLREAEFEVVQEERKKLAAPAWPAFKRTAAGEIYPTLANLYQALRREDVCAHVLAYDRFRDAIVITSDKQHAFDWRALADNDYTLLQLHLERSVGFQPITLDLLRRTVQAVAYENSFDSACIWLEGLTWDGVPRVDRFMADYMKSEDTAYARAVSRYLWTALAGRVLAPGIKADMVPIFEGAQGTFKSSTVAAISPKPEFFCRLGFDEKEDNLSRKIRGRLVAELAELKGLKTKALEAIKDFISATHETWVPKWKEHPTNFARRLVFIATTNDTELLDDETGNRRWLPIHVGLADIEAVERDRDQLWAEGREMFRKSSVCFQEAQYLAPEAHKDYGVLDPWSEVVQEWLGSPMDFDSATPLAKGYVTIREVLRDALHIEPKSLKGIESKRIAKIFRKMRYERKKSRSNKDSYIWMPPSAASGLL